MRTLTTFFLLFLYLNLFPQDDKTVKNFENAINKGYINSPTLIPITIVANKEKKHFLSNTESLYYAAEKEINEKNSDSIKNYLFKNISNQTYEFNNLEALEIIRYYDSKSINFKQIEKIDKYIKRKKIIDRLHKLNDQKKYNYESYKKFYKQKLIIRDQILLGKQLNRDDRKLLDYLATNIITDDNDISELGMWANYENSKNIFDLWKKEIHFYKLEYSKHKNVENKLIENFVNIPKKKFGSNYYVALFKYGVLFFVSDLDGITYFEGIVD